MWATEYSGTRLARVPLAVQDEDCDTLVDPSGETDCTYEYNPVCGVPENLPPVYRGPKCMNPCVVEHLLPGASIKNADGTWAHRYSALSLDLAADGTVVNEQGYLLPNGQFVFWPRLMAFFPSPIDKGTCTKMGLGNSVHLAPDGVVWAADYCGKRLERLTPRP